MAVSGQLINLTSLHARQQACVRFWTSAYQQEHLEYGLHLL